MEPASLECMRVADGISATILTMYANNARMMHLRFGKKVISLKDFFRVLLSSVSKMVWPIDSEEIGRAWPELLILPPNADGMYLDVRIPHMGPAEEVALNPEGIHKTVLYDPNRPAQRRAKLNVDTSTGSLRAPSSEVRLSTFKRCWFLSSMVFLKRFHVPTDVVATTLFICRTPRRYGGTRFTLTWLPHVHGNAHNIDRRTQVKWHSTARATTKIWKGGSANEPSTGEVKAIAWNVMGTVNGRFGKALKQLVERETPHVVILLGASEFGAAAHTLTSSLGYTRMVSHHSDLGLGNDVWVLWNPLLVDVTAFPFYPNGRHLRIKAVKQEFAHEELTSYPSPNP